MNKEKERESAQERALILSKALRRRDDERVRKLIEDFAGDLDYEGHGLKELAISGEAWQCINQLKVEPRMVFVHPDLLMEHPEASLHYRGIATLSLKRVGNIAANVATWESRTSRRTPNRAAVLKVARLYNAVISTIIEGTDQWALENGYRNIVATIGIGLDGSMRNIIGREAEDAVRERLSRWIKNSGIPYKREDSHTFLLGQEGMIRMKFGSEPDILFERRDKDQGTWTQAVTIEIKAGTDPAGALERLGAMKKSFDKTRARVANIALLGVVTPAMRAELDDMSIEDFDLYSVLNTDEGWKEFTREVFDHELRLLMQGSHGIDP